MQIKEAVVALSALAQETRLAAYRLLVEAGPEGIPAGRIAEFLAVAPAALSFHLKELSHARLVSCRQEGRFLYYSADFERMAAVMTFLTHNCCKGMPQECLTVMETALGDCLPSATKRRRAKSNGEEVIMHMRGQAERHFAVKLTHQKNYQYLSQASEGGRLHGKPYLSDEPDPVGDAAGPSTPALLASALGHCLSASLLEALKHAHVEILGYETDAVAVVKPNKEGKPRIERVDVTLRPRVAQRYPRMQRCEETFENYCTVTQSVKTGVEVRIQVDWQIESENKKPTKAAE